MVGEQRVNNEEKGERGGGVGFRQVSYQWYTSSVGCAKIFISSLLSISRTEFKRRNLRAYHRVLEEDYIITNLICFLFFIFLTSFSFLSSSLSPLPFKGSRKKGRA